MYILRRLLYLPVSLILLSLVCFGLRGFIPGDPVAATLPDGEARLVSGDPAAFDRIYRRAASKLGYDNPVFYFSISNAALPDTLRRIARPEERQMLRALTLDAGSWTKVARYYEALRTVAYYSKPSGTTSESTVQTARRLLLQNDPQRIGQAIERLRTEGQAPELIYAHEAMYTGGGRGNLLLPKLRWHGTQNQYHQWLVNLLRGELGRSTLDGQPIRNKIGDALPWTLLINALALFVILVVSIPLGLHLARKSGSKTDRRVSVGLFVLYGIPSFWAATLAATFLTTPAIGIDLFPSMGVGQIPADANWWDVFQLRAAHLFLPVMCLAYPSWAYVTRHLRDAGLGELKKNYVKTALMKGLTDRKIMWKHVLRNASFPLITILGTLFPAMLAGSILIERIFNLPGMGRLLYRSAVEGDWPVVIVLVLLNGVLTTVGLLVSDLAYAAVDPRVNLARQSPLKPTLV